MWPGERGISDHATSISNWRSRCRPSAIEHPPPLSGADRIKPSRFRQRAAMRRFPSAGHLLSWAGLCPRSDESAGKRRSTRLRHGAPWLKTTLVQCAWAAARKKGGYLQAQFQRLRTRRGPKKAICAVAASILTAAYHMLRDGTFYQDLGPDHFSRRAK